MHSLGILHSDIHHGNVIMHPTTKIFKIIDMGKATLVSFPKTYNIIPGSVEHKKYEKYHRHLAYELRNEPGTRQSIWTDTYSVGYFIKHLEVPALVKLGRQLKAVPVKSRVSLKEALSLINI